MGDIFQCQTIELFVFLFFVFFARYTQQVVSGNMAAESSETLPLKDTSAVIEFDWLLENIVYKESSTVLATETLHFGPGATLQLAVKNCHFNKSFSDTRIQVYALSRHFQQLGLQVKKIVCSVNDPSDQKKVRGRTGKLHLICRGVCHHFFFGKFDQYQPFQGGPSFSCLLSFSLFLGGNTEQFVYQANDVLLKDQLWTAVQQKVCTDLEFVVGHERNRRTFAAHRFVAAARSPVLAALLLHLPERDRAIEIEDIDPAVFHQFLYFLYTGQLLGTVGNGIDLGMLANRFQVATLVDLCRIHTTRQDPADIFDCIKDMPSEKTCSVKR